MRKRPVSNRTLALNAAYFSHNWDSALVVGQAILWHPRARRAAAGARVLINRLVLPYFGGRAPEDPDQVPTRFEKKLTGKERSSFDGTCFRTPGESFAGGAGGAARRRRLPARAEFGPAARIGWRAGEHRLPHLRAPCKFHDIRSSVFASASEWAQPPGPPLSFSRSGISRLRA
jgi:hypothetical protein